MTATNIVASKYLHGTIGTPERESGVRALVTRVAETIRDWGMAQGYFKTPEDGATFHDELAHILIRQYAAFNSPVWFNVGCDRIEPDSDARNWHWNPVAGRVEFGVTGYSTPQCSACFINSVQDSLDSILTLAKTEGMLFKWGSGTGTNLSPLRSSTEGLSGGGTASGPLSFMKGFDAFAGVIKSGGKTRRAAKMVILNIDHPDIIDFIECKSKEEAKAHTLVAAGYDGSSPDSEAYSSIFFQNANNSVRVTDDFMYAVLRDTDFTTRAVQDGRPMQTFKAKDLLFKISDATWRCGDPGMQYDTTVNRWHTSKNTAPHQRQQSVQRIHVPRRLSLQPGQPEPAEVRAQRHLRRGSLSPRRRRSDHRAGNSGRQRRLPHRNDRQEFPRLPSAGLRLRKSRRIADGRRPTLRLRRRTRLRRLRNRHHVRPSLSAILKHRRTLPAISPSHRANTKRPGRNQSRQRRQSSMPGGACPGWYINREPFLDVIRMHRASVNNINKNNVPTPLYEASKQTWDEALANGEKHGYRNSQVTVLAPTGTIGFMMDCDTTGIEPDLALGEVQEAGRRRDDQDCEQYCAYGFVQAGVLA